MISAQQVKNRTREGADAVKLWSSADWCAYFERNASVRPPIRWESAGRLADDERRAVARSVQEFQLGESSEGRHLFHAAKLYAARSGDHKYYEAIEYFIREEQRHARELKQFLAHESIAPIRHSPADRVFRWLRRGASLEIMISVLVTAEIIAQVYYVALKNATHSAALQKLCEQILQDEEAHVRFQAERLAILRQKRPPSGLLLAEILQRILFYGTCWVVWWKHGNVVRAGHQNWHWYWGAGWQAFDRAAGLMDPKTYGFVATDSSV